MMLCTENYPNVLAFSFLDELQKEFITTYNMMKTNTAVRPYCFIEFGKGLIFSFSLSHLHPVISDVLLNARGEGGIWYLAFDK